MNKFKIGDWVMRTHYNDNRPELQIGMVFKVSYVDAGYVNLEGIPESADIDWFELDKNATIHELLKDL